MFKAIRKGRAEEVLAEVHPHIPNGTLAEALRSEDPTDFTYVLLLLGVQRAASLELRRFDIIERTLASMESQLEHYPSEIRAAGGDYLVALLHWTIGQPTKNRTAILELVRTYAHLHYGFPADALINDIQQGRNPFRGQDDAAEPHV